MDPISRRNFITRTSAVVAAAGAATMVPMQLAGATTRPAPAEEHTAPAPAAAANSAEPVVAHLRNLETGEIALYQGLREVTIHDRALASRLARATGGN